jgi:hypothetical protein
MFQRKPRRFTRHRSNDRGHPSRPNGHGQPRIRPSSFSNGPTRNNFRPTQSPEKLLEKYNTLAKEAISSGDKMLGENYLQHADHFIRIIEDKNKNRLQNKINVVPDAESEKGAQSETNDSAPEKIIDPTPEKTIDSTPEKTIKNK